MTNEDDRGSGYVAAATAAELLATSRGPHAPTRAMRFITGWQPLDDILGGGFRAQDLVVLGGRPGVGKTVAALQWARTIAMEGSTAIYVSYQHSPHSLLHRLLTLELASIARTDEVTDLTRLRTIAQEVVLGAAPAAHLTVDPLGEEAFRRLEAYGPRLRLVQASGLRTGVVELSRILSEQRGGATALFVDYLQKIPIDGRLQPDGPRTTFLAERLKELAMIGEVPVVVVAGADREGLTSRNVHLHHLRGSTALAHEADLVMILNDKTRAVSPTHIEFDPVRAEEYRRWMVLSVEKHRDGWADVHLEFRKDLASYRFDPHGGLVTETLADRVGFEE